jgi:DnaK suppressor protein
MSGGCVTSWGWPSSESAMADTDETARTSTDRARRVLRAQLAALTDRMHTESDVLNVRVTAGDFVDAAQGMEQQELARLTASRLAQCARRVEIALSRVSDGQYGICSECGGVIPPKRLVAVPDATTCVACQDHLEHRPPGPRSAYGPRRPTPIDSSEEQQAGTVVRPGR